MSYINIFQTKTLASAILLSFLPGVGTAQADTQTGSVQNNLYGGAPLVFKCKLELGQIQNTTLGELQDVHLSFQNPGPATLTAGSTLDWDLTKRITYKVGKKKDKEQFSNKKIGQTYTLTKDLPAKQWHLIKTFSNGYVYKPIVGYLSHIDCGVIAGNLKFKQTPGVGKPSANNKFGSKVVEIKQNANGNTSQAKPKLPKLPAKAKPMPDLLVEKVVATPYPDCKSARAINVSFRIKNIGNADFPMLNGKETLFLHAGTEFYTKGVTLPKMTFGQFYSNTFILSNKNKLETLAGKTVMVYLMLNKDHLVAEPDYNNNGNVAGVTFPSDYCKASTNTPPAGQRAPQSGTRSPTSDRSTTQGTGSTRATPGTDSQKR